MQLIKGQDPGPGKDKRGAPEDSQFPSSGEGAASAYARMKSQRERLARHNPGEETSAGTRKDGKS